jgi:hypothetical protein
METNLEFAIRFAHRLMDNGYDRDEAIEHAAAKIKHVTRDEVAEGVGA